MTQAVVTEKRNFQSNIVMNNERYLTGNIRKVYDHGNGLKLLLPISASRSILIVK